MKDKGAIIFLHLSDMHIDKEKDISNEHIGKIVDSLKSFKSIKIKNIIIFSLVHMKFMLLKRQMD